MRKLRIHCFQHVPFEGLAIIKTWIEKKGHQLTYTRFFNNGLMPDINEIDWLIVMGGPMSFDDENIYPWIAKEKQFIKTAVQNNKAVIGICLGAQLIVEAIGAKGLHGNGNEIGWFPVQFNKENLITAGLDFIPETLTPFHWHGDTFEIPDGALHLASSETYPNQAFIYKDRILGFQFHIELDEKAMNIISGHLIIENKNSKHVQSKKEILIQKKYFSLNNSVMFKLLDRFESILLQILS